MFSTQQVRQKFLEFYSQRGHRLIPSASLVPENDPTTLFTSSGMQPLVPYLLGQPHPEGRRLANCQRSFRAGDLDEVGDSRHTTFFEMLGNWSLGDYSKEQQLSWVFQFLTEVLGLEPDRIWVSVFAGEGGLPRDQTSLECWRQLFGGDQRIVAYGFNQNWWSRAGSPESMPPGEPGGPDSEVFYEFVDVLHNPEFGPHCHPNCDCGRFLEIGNSVFMEYQKQTDGSLHKLPQSNIDFGGGLERMVAACHNSADVFRIDSLTPGIELLVQLSGRAYQGSNQRPMRIVTDHIRSSAIMLSDGVIPSNKAQGYVLRRLIRRAMRHARGLGLPDGFTLQLAREVLDFYQLQAPLHLLESEEGKFATMLTTGLREVEKLPELTGSVAFHLFETYGFPLEMTQEIASERGQPLNAQEFTEQFQRHRELSRSASQSMFKGGLADHTREVVSLHTATHLLHQALRQVLGSHVRQMGSNITQERLRFDFAHSDKLSANQLLRIEEIVNQQIKADLPVTQSHDSYTQAVAGGALAFFGERYPERVSIYTIGDFSREICGGPHRERTGQLGHFTVTRQESAGAGVRRLYARLQTAGAQQESAHSGSETAGVDRAVRGRGPEE